MYAIIQTGSKQFTVKVGDIIEIEKLDNEIGQDVVISDVLAIGADDGKLNFASKKSRTTSDSQEISPNKLLLGGCAADKLGEGAKATAALDFSTSKLTPIHGGAVNVFFLDGSVLSLDDDVLAASKIYYPGKADSKIQALPINSNMIW